MAATQGVLPVQYVLPLQYVQHSLCQPSLIVGPTEAAKFMLLLRQPAETGHSTMALSMNQDAGLGWDPELRKRRGSHMPHEQLCAKQTDPGTALSSSYPLHRLECASLAGSAEAAVHDELVLMIHLLAEDAVPVAVAAARVDEGAPEAVGCLRRRDGRQAGVAEVREEVEERSEVAARDVARRGLRCCCDVAGAVGRRRRRRWGSRCGPHQAPRRGPR